MEGMNFTQNAQSENGNNPVFDAIAEATAAPKKDKLPKRGNRREYTKEERRRYIDTLESSGRKGVKMPRINLALTLDNLKYVKCMGQASGDGMTAFINLIIHQHMEEHAELYEKAKEFRKVLEENI